MRFSPYATKRLRRRLGLCLFPAFLAAASGQSLIDVAGSSSVMKPLEKSPGVYMADPRADAQTGQTQADIIGSATQAAAWIQFGSLNNQDAMAFRVRLDSLSSNFSTNVRFGFDLNVDGTVDLFLGVIYQGSNPTHIGYWDATGTGSTANTSPSTTSMSAMTAYNVAVATTGVGANYNYQLISTTNTPGYEPVPGVGGAADTTTDAVLTFATSLATFQSAAQDAAVMGPAFTFSSTSNFRVTVITSTQTNSINQDVLGPGAGSSTVRYDDPVSGGFTQTILPSGDPIPEPGTFAAVGLLLAPAVLIRRRRRPSGA